MNNNVLDTTKEEKKYIVITEKNNFDSFLKMKNLNLTSEKKDNTSNSPTNNTSFNMDSDYLETIQCFFFKEENYKKYLNDNDRINRLSSFEENKIKSLEDIKNIDSSEFMPSFMKKQLNIA